MSIRFNLLSRPLLLTFLVAWMLSCGGGGSQFDDVCTDYANVILDCLEFNTNDARAITRKECVQELEEAADFDGDACVAAQIATFECLGTETCENLFEFFDLENKDLFETVGGMTQETPPLDYCDTEIRLAAEICPISVVFRVQRN